MKTILLTITITILLNQASYSQSEASHYDYKYELQMADSFMDNKDYQQAIFFLAKLIEKTKENTDYKLYALAQKALCKVYVHDYRGAIVDADEVFEMAKTNVIPVIAHRLDLQNEIDDWKGLAHLAKGMAESSLGLTNEACIDWSKAGELGAKDAYKFILQYCK